MATDHPGIVKKKGPIYASQRGWILLYCPGLSFVFYVDIAVVFYHCPLQWYRCPRWRKCTNGQKRAAEILRNSTVLWIDYLRAVDRDNYDYNT